LKPHFHLHALVPGGVLAEQGTRWVSTHPKYLFPVTALGEVLRGKFLVVLRTSEMTQTLRFTEHTQHLSTKAGLAHLIDQLYDKNWVVYAKRPFKGPEQVLEYIGRYTHRVAISNHRLVDVREGRVRFTYRHRKKGNQLQTLELPAGFVRIRHYGLLANRCKAETLRQCRQALGQSPAPPAAAPKSIAQWMQQWTGIDITCCPQCGYQPLVRTPLPVTGGTAMTRAP